MNHLEAQSYIMPFIDGKVPANRRNDFVLHMRNCKRCHKELEIYYTLMVGMRQLDNNQVLSSDFDRDLENELNKLSHKAKTKKRVSLSVFSALLIAIIIMGFATYTSGLSRVYLYEQRTKMESQGDYYFKDNLEDYLCIEGYDRVYVSDEIADKNKVTAFDRIRGYQRMEKDVNRIIDFGEEIRDAKTTSD
ncbi:hypothetical protein SAMN06297422_10436 [Lachnospiraceae bacterium]|nr:hypothetical protein SAMN06297422_10436 [Lachnospiraceae bacterium]